jgi:phosphatidylinositol 3-kinase
LDRPEALADLATASALVLQELPVEPPSTTTSSIPLAPPTPLETELANVFKIYDPDADRENLVEAKHRRLVRSQRTGRWDRELKPDARSRDELNVRRRRCTNGATATF